MLGSHEVVAAHSHLYTIFSTDIVKLLGSSPLHKYIADIQFRHTPLLDVTCNHTETVCTFLASHFKILYEHTMPTNANTDCTSTA